MLQSTHCFSPSCLYIFRGGREEGKEQAVQTEEMQELEELKLRLQKWEKDVEEQGRVREELERRLKEREEEVEGSRKQLEEAEQERVRRDEEERVRREEESRTRREERKEETVQRPEQEREDGDGASVADEPVQSSPCLEASCYPTTLEEQAAMMAAPRPLPPSLLHLLPQVLPLPSQECRGSPEHLLATTLPLLVPSLVVSTRPDLLPLLLWTVARSNEQEVRDTLLQLTFNLVKRPEAEVRLQPLTSTSAIAPGEGEDSGGSAVAAVPGGLGQLQD